MKRAKEIKKLSDKIAVRDRLLAHKTQSLASNLRESRIGENHDYQANLADDIVTLQIKQSDDIDRLVILTHGGGTGDD